MRNTLFLLGLLVCTAVPATAQVSIGIGLPRVSIGIDLPMYPDLVPVPGYPVYYAPSVNSNYFFYDGMYWVYQDDNWYASSWYNGPWQDVPPEAVPLFVLRIPVRYYRHAPAYFRGWRADAPPRWDEHWGRAWAQRRSGWNTWDHKVIPPRPPLPVYQKKYSGNRYPRVEQQQALQSKNYRYQPHDPLVRQEHNAQRTPAAPAQGRPPAPPQGNGNRAPRAVPPQIIPTPPVPPMASPSPRTGTPHRESPPVTRHNDAPPAQPAPAAAAPRASQAPARDRNRDAREGNRPAAPPPQQNAPVAPPPQPPRAAPPPRQQPAPQIHHIEAPQPQPAAPPPRAAPGPQGKEASHAPSPGQQPGPDRGKADHHDEPRGGDHRR